MRRTLLARALVAALAVATLSIVAPRAAAQSEGLGPGPFASIRLTPKGIVFALRSGSNRATLFSGSPRLFAARNLDYTPFEGKTVVKDGGARLVQRGTVEGLSIDDYFAHGEQRRIKIRNGDNTTTEVDVIRSGDILQAAYVVRSPAAAAPLFQSGYVQTDALANGSVEIALPKPYANGELETTVALTLPELPVGFDSLRTTIIARNVETGGYASSVFAGLAGGPVTFHHIALAPGEYTFEVQYDLGYGSYLTSSGGFTTIERVPGTFRVTLQERAFAIAASPLDLPPFVETRVTLHGLDRYAPSPLNKYDAFIFLHGDGTAWSHTLHREIIDGGPLEIDVRAPEAPLRVYAGLNKSPANENGSGFYANAEALPVDGEPTAFEIPPLVRIDGTVRDPNLALAANTEQRIASNRVDFSFSTDETSGESTGQMNGFARGYSVLLPRGVPVRQSAYFEVALGAEPTRAGENGTGSIRKSFDERTFDADTTVDVTVPAVPGYVVVTGRLVDHRGRAVAQGQITASSSDLDGLEDWSFQAYANVRNGEFRIRLLPGRAYALSAYGYFSRASRWIGRGRTDARYRPPVADGTEHQSARTKPLVNVYFVRMEQDLKEKFGKRIQRCPGCYVAYYVRDMWLGEEGIFFCGDCKDDSMFSFEDFAAHADLSRLPSMQRDEDEDGHHH
jgi:hypothetical protein